MSFFKQEWIQRVGKHSYECHGALILCLPLAGPLQSACCSSLLAPEHILCLCDSPRPSYIEGFWGIISSYLLKNTKELKLEANPSRHTESSIFNLS